MNLSRPAPVPGMKPLQPGQWDQMAPMLTECFLQLYSYYGVDATRVLGAPVSERFDRDEFASFVGLIGPHARGALLTIAPLPVILGSHPLSRLGQPFPESLAQDWHNELSNQLAGRLKSKLIPHGVGDLRLTPPKCLIGSGLRGFSREHDRVLAFRAMEMPVRVVLELYVDDALDLGQVVTPEEDHLGEGEFLMF